MVMVTLGNHFVLRRLPSLENLLYCAPSIRTGKMGASAVQGNGARSLIDLHQSPGYGMRPSGKMTICSPFSNGAHQRFNGHGVGGVKWQKIKERKRQFAPTIFAQSAY